MSKKDKLSLDNVVSRINKEIESTSKQFDKMMNEAFRQLDTLQSQLHAPIKKIIEDVDKIRDREVNRIQTEFDKRIKEFSDLQEQLLEKVGVEKSKLNKAVSKVKKPVAKKTTTTPAAKKPAAKKPAAKKPTVTPAAKKPAAKKPAAKKPTATPAAKKPAAKKPAVTSAAKKPAAKKPTVTPVAKKPAAKKPKATPAAKKPAAKKPATTATAKSENLTKITGLGPATAKKLKEAGITSFAQIATPNTKEKAELEKFSKLKGYATWANEAKKLI
jgi:predicted flap endonuclease-1-like 5' DNA nuclease